MRKGGETLPKRKKTNRSVGIKIKDGRKIVTLKRKTMKVSKNYNDGFAKFLNKANEVRRLRKMLRAAEGELIKMMYSNPKVTEQLIRKRLIRSEVNYEEIKKLTKGGLSIVKG